MTLRYLDNALIAGMKTTTAPRNPSTSGYGPKIPTRYMLKLKGRWHRVYMMQYSNSGSSYVNLAGHDMLLTSDAEHALQAHRNADADGRGTPTVISALSMGDRFRFHHDGVACTLTELSEGGRYGWHDYQGDHHSWAGSYSDTGVIAWPLVYPTTDPETVMGQP